MIFGAATFLVVNLYGQGCSDAGLCSMGALESSQNRARPSSIISFSHNIGMGEHFERGEKKTLINSFILGGKVYLSRTTMVDLKIPYIIVTGDLANTDGIGDISLSVSQRIIQDSKMQILLTVGTRLKTNNADRSNANLPLPMPFQTSLGSNDLLIGLTSNYFDWQFSIGYQHPFGRNNNGFLRSLWPENNEAQEYFESNQLKRGDDVAIRVEKRFDGQRLDFFLGILGLYRIQKDEIIKEGRIVQLSRSSAPTVNLNGTLVYQLSPKINLRMTYGNPIVWRKSRADGLERVFSFTSGVEFRL